MRRLAVLIIAATVLAACGGGDGEPEGVAETLCVPTGTTLAISANDLEFDLECLAAPQREPFTIDFTNNDRAQPHNVAIYVDESAKDELFKGEVVDGGKEITYEVQGLDAGQYYFRCDVHPQMDGGFVVK